MLCSPAGSWVTEDLVKEISCFKWQTPLLPLSVTTLSGEPQPIQDGNWWCKHVQYLWCSNWFIVQCQGNLNGCWILRKSEFSTTFTGKLVLETGIQQAYHIQRDLGTFVQRTRKDCSWQCFNHLLAVKYNRNLWPLYYWVKTHLSILGSVGVLTNREILCDHVWISSMTTLWYCLYAHTQSKAGQRHQ